MTPLFLTRLLTVAALTGALATQAFAADGMIELQSQNSFQATRDKLIDTLKAKGMKIFTVVDHASGARSAGLKLRPTTVVIFGNPKAGTQLMQCAQTAGIDLPMKALIWEDAKGVVRLGYNDPAWMAARHHVDDCKIVTKMSKALGNFARAATTASR